MKRFSKIPVSKSVLLLSCCFLFLLTAMKCHKEDPVSPDTVSLLQHKWNYISESQVYPTKPTLNTRYNGMPQDYFTFDSNGKAYTYKSGDPIFHNADTANYTIKTNNKISFGPAGYPQIDLTIVTLTDHLLVLANPISAEFINGSNREIYYGTRTDSLSR